MRDVVKMLLVLFVTCGLAAASLGVVNRVTKERIANWEKQRKQAAFQAVFADADEFVEVTPDNVWEARAKGQSVGRAFLTRIQGYSGPITLVFGVDAGGAVTGLEVLGHSETPGLGAKIGSTGFRAQFRGKRAEQLQLKKDDPRAGAIDAITGATISSRAVTKALRTTVLAAGDAKAGGCP